MSRGRSKNVTLPAKEKGREETTCEIDPKILNHVSTQGRQRLHNFRKFEKFSGSGTKV